MIVASLKFFGYPRNEIRFLMVFILFFSEKTGIEIMTPSESRKSIIWYQMISFLSNIIQPHSKHHKFIKNPANYVRINVAR